MMRKLLALLLVLMIAVGFTACGGSSGKNAWSKENPEFWYQYFYPFGFESSGVNPIVQELFAKDLAPEEAAKELQDALEKWKSQNPEQLAAFEKWEVLE